MTHKTAWAVEKPDGAIIAETDFKTEERAWEVCLGWPSKEDIDYAKRHGYKAYRVTLVPVSE